MVDLAGDLDNTVRSACLEEAVGAQVGEAAGGDNITGGVDAKIVEGGNQTNTLIVTNSVFEPGLIPEATCYVKRPNDSIG